jgi:hypothetical protein
MTDDVTILPYVYIHVKELKTHAHAQDGVRWTVGLEHLQLTEMLQE